MIEGFAFVVKRNRPRNLRHLSASRGANSGQKRNYFQFSVAMGTKIEDRINYSQISVAMGKAKKRKNQLFPDFGSTSQGPERAAGANAPTMARVDQPAHSRQVTQLRATQNASTGYNIPSDAVKRISLLLPV